MYMPSPISMEIVRNTCSITSTVRAAPTASVTANNVAPVKANNLCKWTCVQPGVQLTDQDVQSVTASMLYVRSHEHGLLLQGQADQCNVLRVL